MTHLRSFQHMSAEERLLQQHFKDYQLELLQGGTLAPLKRWGIGGVDEFLYLLKTPTQHSRQALRERLELELAELNKSQPENEVPKLSTEMHNLTSIQPNASTFFAYQEAISQLRAPRLETMRDTGQELFFIEKLDLLKSSIQDKFTSATEQLGSFGSLLREQALWVLAGIGYAVGGAIFPFFLKATEKHDLAAQDYKSTPIGLVCYPTKRDFVESVDNAIEDLNYRKPVKIETKDGDFVIPGKDSNPQRARSYIQDARNIIERTNNPEIIQQLEIDENSKSRIATAVDNSVSELERADSTLRRETDTKVQYSHQQKVLKEATKHSERIVRTLEPYMDNNVVSNENHTHQVRKTLKWAMGIAFSIGGIFTYNASRRGRNLRTRESYYGY